MPLKDDELKEVSGGNLIDAINFGTGALGTVFNLQREINKLIDKTMLSKDDADKVIDAYKNFNKVLGVFNFDSLSVEVPEDILKMAQDRQTARKNKDFAKADELRDAIKDAGWVVEDTPAGPRFIKL